jgi:hypothetical protein
MKQTAVEWLANEMPVIDWKVPYWKIKLEKAKQREKELHGDTWDSAIEAHEARGHVIARSTCDFDDYYDKTFNTKEK